jgi:hypothetical protein
VGDTVTAVNPKGIFDRSTKGYRLDPVTVPVERERIRFFCRVLGVADPIHFDVGAAQAEGYSDIVAPPSFFTVIDAAANEERKRLGQMSSAELVKCDGRRLLHGDETYEYLGPIIAGDMVTLASTVTDFYDKKGGALEFVTFVSLLKHPARGVLVRATRTLLHRLG